MMLRLILVMLSITLLSATICLNDASAVDKSNLVAYWSFDKGAGGTVADDSGNGHAGKVMDASWSKEGKSKSAMSFNGVGAFVDVPNEPNLDPQGDDWTIDLWLKRADSAGGWQKILTKYPGNWTGYRVGLLDSSVHVIFGAGPAPDNVEFNTATTIQDLDWHHLAVVVDRSDDAIIYIDGKPDDKTMSVEHIGPVKTDNNVEIGRCHWCGGGATMGFNGTLDEIKIWRAALTEGEVQLAINGQLPPTSAVSFSNALPTTWAEIKK